MDSHSIWGDSPNHLTIDPKRLERLDYLVAQFKRNGVYVDMNLHVSRWFDQAEGFVARQQRPKFDKGLDNFEPRMIELQKKYARDLLTHVNPYTNNSYATSRRWPSSRSTTRTRLFSQWSWGQLDDLPEPYATTFRKLWNAWLRKKYGDTAALRRGVEGQPTGRWGPRCSPAATSPGTLPGHWHLKPTTRPRPVGRSKRAGPTAAAS